MIISTPDRASRTNGSWDYFDLVWLNETYPETRDIISPDYTGEFDNLLLLTGRCGYSPNPFFDEIYYVQRYPDVRQSIQDGIFVSGFDHYRSVGYRERDPHWLFSEEYYIATNADVRRILMNDTVFRNGYDHYIHVGDSEFRSGSWFFDPLEYIKSTSGEIVRTPFAHYLARQSGYSNSAWFDTDWYIATYPDVIDKIRRGEWKSILHQYLSERNNSRYDPCRYFSECFYVESNPDIADAIASGQFNSGYEHFLLYGIRERRRPSPEVDLETYYHQPHVRKLLLNGRSRDVFVSWCRSGGNAPDVGTVLVAEEKAIKYAFEKKSASIAINTARRKLDFSSADPDISVIMVLHNNFDMTMNALTALRASHAGNIHLIIVDSGSQDETRHIERYISGATILRFEGNIGFVRACNAALPSVTAPLVLFLNNDTEIQPGSISAATERFRHMPQVGVIGGKLIRTNGLLQEAGSIIFRDGSVMGYMRDASPDAPEANFLRQVDFCSGACLFTRTDLLQRLGGFDEAYIPAYYEETDYCVRVWKSGYQVLYDPSVTAIHYEYGTSDSDSGSSYISRNRLVFNVRHTDFLSRKLVRSGFNIEAARSPRNADSRRILFIEDRIPLKYYGSGFSRSSDMIISMANLGYEVTIFPIYKPTVPTSHLYLAFPETVEIVWDREMNDLEAFLRQRTGVYDVIWICRTHNIRRLFPVIERTAHLMPRTALIADTEAVSSIRDEKKDELAGIPRENQPLLADRLRAECECLFLATQVVAVSSQDAHVLTKQGFSNVPVLGHAQRPRPTSNPWADRSGLLFVGAIHDQDSPNYDSIAWFTTVIWPMLERALPADVKLVIAGHLGPKASLLGLPRSSRILYLGEVDDLAPLYDNARFFIAPTRYAAGIPYKLHEAAAYGLPIIASALLSHQLGWNAGNDLLEARTGDAEDFVSTILGAYENHALWARLRGNALLRIMMENDPQCYDERIDKILKAC